MRTTIDQLDLVCPSSPFVAVQINTDIPDREDYREIVEQVLAGFAIQYPEKRITIYTHVSFGMDFGMPAQCLMIGAARSQPLIDALLIALRRYMKDGVRKNFMRITDEVFTEFHIENGILWRKIDELYWNDVSTAIKQDVDKKKTVGDWDDVDWEESEDDVDENDEDEQLQINTETSARNPNLYADGKLTVGQLQKKIEDCFGLPRGSVQLCGQEKKIRPNALISTLRKRWEE